MQIRNYDKKYIEDNADRRMTTKKGRWFHLQKILFNLWLWTIFVFLRKKEKSILVVQWFNLMKVVKVGRVTKQSQSNIIRVGRIWLKKFIIYDLHTWQEKKRKGKEREWHQHQINCSFDLPVKTNSKRNN